MIDNAQPQADEPANQPEYDAAVYDGEQTEDAGGSDEPFLTVRYNKEDKPLSKEAAVEYAQKGMNYDKVSRRLREASEKLGQYENSEMYKAARAFADKSGQTVDAVLRSMHASFEAGSKQKRINGQLGDFMRRNPGVDPRQLPHDVMNSWQSGVPLGEAYTAHMMDQKARALEKELNQTKTNQKNTAASMGRAQSFGNTYFKPLSEEAIKTMTPQELDRNHNRIWAMLTGVK